MQHYAPIDTVQLRCCLRLTRPTGSNENPSCVPQGCLQQQAVAVAHLVAFDALGAGGAEDGGRLEGVAADVAGRTGLALRVAPRWQPRPQRGLCPGGARTTLRLLKRAKTQSSLFLDMRTSSSGCAH